MLLWAHFDWQHADWKIFHNPQDPAIDLSLPTHFRHIKRLRNRSLSISTRFKSGRGGWGGYVGGGVRPCAKERKNTVFISGNWIWFWCHRVWVYIGHFNQKILVNYCPLVFSPLLCSRFLGPTHLQGKLLLTGDADPLFWGVTVRLTCVLEH